MFKELIGKTIKDIVEFEEDGCVQTINIVFEDGTKYSIIGGSEGWGYNGDDEYRYDIISMELFNITEDDN